MHEFTRSPSHLVTQTPDELEFALARMHFHVKLKDVIHLVTRRYAIFMKITHNLPIRDL